MALTNYHKKRDFRKTPEPKGEKAKRRKKLAFVVQEHQASQLHYDFRLELDGVLKSWAVPKGPSMNPHDKHLAMMVEDHPLEYRKFEGTIPEGNYGAGEVIIWDKGTYTAHHPDDDELKALRHGLKKGHLVIELDGEKLKGEFALIKMQNAKEKNAWLLVKKDDEYASEKDITKQTESVVSGKNLNVPTQDYKEYPKQKVDEPVKPMLATLTDEPFTAEDWLFEIKWDGYRAIASKHSHTVKLYSRNDQDFRQTYPSIYEALQDIKHDFILDGEIVAIDEAGTPHFEWLQNWHRTPEGSLYYYVFDIIAFHGHDLHTMPLIERKALLQHIIPKDSPIRFSDHIEKDGEKLFREVKKQHIEGIMAKKATSHYKQNTRGKDWLKIKTHNRQEVVIGGFTEPRGSRQHLGALIVGVYNDKGDLIYTGHSGGGIPDTARKELRQKLEKRERKTSPFKTEPKPNAPVHWVKPELVCEMEFSEWTSDGSMRHPKFIGMREDKKAKSVHKETVLTKEESDLHDTPSGSSRKPKKLGLSRRESFSAERQWSPAAGAGEPRFPKGYREGRTSTKEKTMPLNKPEFTHLDKPFWPEHGYTKGDLIHYYDTVADYILPYLKNRPESLKRNPDGVGGMSFFQKDITHPVPDFAQTETIFSESTNEDVHYLVCNNKQTLLYMAQLGCIEINPWNSRTSHLDKPDWGVIDLDPEGVDFKGVVKVAQTVHKVCEELGIPHYPKTSGKRGIHIYLPLNAKYTYAQARDFIHLLVIEINKRIPDLTSLERKPAKRQGKVYLDYLQNAEGQTLAAPYSVRPTKDATVSTPLHWSEVTTRLTPTQFTMKNIHKRLEKEGDLWEDVRGKGIDISDILERMK